jgi:hypothetical protein
VWLLSSNLSIILGHNRLAIRNINTRVYTTCPVLRICSNDFKAIAVNSTRKGMPKGVLDHARESVDRVLSETSFVQNDALPVVISGQC